MSKISNALYEIEHMNEMADKDQWMNNIHPLVKLVLTIVYICVVVSFDKYNLSGAVSMCIYPLIIFAIAELSWRDAFYRMKIILPVVCIVGIFNPFFDKEIATHIGGIAISGGVISMLSLMVKGVLTVLASYILIATTTIEKICYALRLLHVPKIIVTEVMLIYRYITVLMTEAKRITQAYELRAPDQKGIHISAWGSLVGQLLLRSMDRADDVYESMCLRGYNGEYSFYNRSRFGFGDACFATVWLFIFILFRLFPVFQIVGGLFT